MSAVFFHLPANFLKQTINEIASRNIELIAPEDGTHLQEKMPLLNWDSPGDADEYEVQISLI